MEKNKWSEYENYIVMAMNTVGLHAGYESFLKFKEITKFLKRIASTPDNDSFLYEKTIYKKVISSVDATNILNKLFKNKFDYRIKVLGNQIGVRL